MYLESYIKSGRIEIVEVPVGKDFNGWSDHGNWSRDFVSQLALGKDGKLKFLNMKYHRESADRSDDFIQSYLAKKYERLLGYQIEVIDVPFYFEWGNFTTDGRGNFFVSEKVFEINNKFKLSLDKRSVGKWIRETFGSQSKIVWITPPKAESTGHVDMIMKFLDSKRVLIVKTDFKLWKNYLERLASDMESRGYEVHRIEMGFSEDEIQNSRWAQFRSYTNSLIIGNTVYVPQYDDANLTIASKDELARKLYRSLGYQMIKIDSSTSINAGGAVHCLTCNIPNLTNFAR